MSYKNRMEVTTSHYNDVALALNQDPHFARLVDLRRLQARGRLFGDMLYKSVAMGLDLLIEDGGVMHFRDASYDIAEAEASQV